MWKPIDSAPTDGTVFMAYDKEWKTNEYGEFPFLFVYMEDDLSWAMTVDGFICHPTHWMPLPEPPTNDTP